MCKCVSQAYIVGNIKTYYTTTYMGSIAVSGYLEYLVPHTAGVK